MDYKLLCEKLFVSAYQSSAYKLNHKLREPNSKEYYYIPSGNYTIVTVLEDLKKSKVNLADKSFIDIGAGTSTIPLIFKIAGCKTSVGLEFDKIFVKLDEDELLFEGNLLRHDFKSYDILYSYNPIKDEELMIEGLKNIINTMKKGAILYFNAASYKVIRYLNNIVKAEKIEFTSIFKYIKK